MCKAQRCQELFAKNSKATELSDSDFSEGTIRKWIIDLNKDSVRKFRLGYVPVKERLLLEGDEKVTPNPHHLTFVNEFFRYNRQMRTGKIEHFDLDLFRRDIEPMIRHLIDLCGPEWISKLARSFRGDLPSRPSSTSNVQRPPTGHTSLKYNILRYSNLRLIAQRLSGEALYKNQVQRLIDIRVVSAEKEEERRLRVCVVGVGEAVLDTPC
jgi:hypothetical protein